MRELVMIGFAEKHRAVEVLSQLQRLKFDWSADLRNAVAVEVEKDGRFRLRPQSIAGSCAWLEFAAMESSSKCDRSFAPHSAIEHS